jgi:ribosomal protein S18 acetylase RimI-like enzyme
VISPARRSVVAVREAQPEDLPTVVELRLALLRENATHPIYGRLRRDVERRATELFAAQLQSDDETVLLAERDGKTVGILRCVESLGSPLLQPARYCYISSVYVRPSERRRGVLQALMEHATAWCVERGLEEMRLHNVPGSDEASAAWTALGFDVVEHVRMRRLRAPSEARAAKRSVPDERR